jgi:hypothetical protein
MLGSYLYQAKSFLFNATGDVVEQVRQEVVTPRVRTLAGIEVTELRAPDAETALKTPAPLRFVGVSVVVPGLNREDLERVAKAYEKEYQTPRVLNIAFFNEVPDWPDKPFATWGLYDHARRSYLRSSTIDGTGRRQRVVPEQPRWGVLEHGEPMRDSEPAN